MRAAPVITSSRPPLNTPRTSTNPRISPPTMETRTTSPMWPRPCSFSSSGRATVLAPAEPAIGLLRRTLTTFLGRTVSTNHASTCARSIRCAFSFRLAAGSTPELPLDKIRGGNEQHPPLDLHVRRGTPGQGFVQRRDSATSIRRGLVQSLRPPKSRETEVDRSSGIPKSSRLLARARRNVETLVLRRSLTWLP